MDLEKLRDEMISAFRDYQKMSGYGREGLWHSYVDLRESFLRADCRQKGLPFIELKAIPMLPEELQGCH